MRLEALGCSFFGTKIGQKFGRFWHCGIFFQMALWHFFHSQFFFATKLRNEKYCLWFWGGSQERGGGGHPNPQTLFLNPCLKTDAPTGRGHLCQTPMPTCVTPQSEGRDYWLLDIRECKEYSQVSPTVIATLTVPVTVTVTVTVTATVAVTEPQPQP